MLILTPDQSELIETIIKWYSNWYRGVRVGAHPQYIAYSGAAGTGKTTVVKEVLNALGLTYGEYMCCAYVGKAVLQLQKHNLSAKTIHSLIYDISLELVYNPILGKRTIKLLMTLKKELPPDIKVLIVDEATMVNDQMVEELLSFNIPIIFLGDMNQLPPVFGVSSVMIRPDFVLSKLMRQAEDDPIVIYSQMILNNIPLPYGKFGESEVIYQSDLQMDRILSYEQTLTTTNKLRYELNQLVRREIRGIDTDRPVLFDRIICRRNNWNINRDGFSLTNGLTGTITDINREYLHKGAYKIDFHPDFFESGIDFENLLMDAKHLMAHYMDQKNKSFTDFELFEYAYAITVHLSQGSEYDSVLFIDTPIYNAELTRKARYTAITRAKKKITIAR